MVTIRLPQLPKTQLTVSAPSSTSLVVQAMGVRSGAEIYDGEYIVTPQAWEQVILETSGKLMSDDVTVKEIPYHRTSNPSGGDTIFIGYQGV